MGLDGSPGIRATVSGPSELRVSADEDPPSIPATKPDSEARDHRVAGVIYAVLAFGWWGTVVPIVFFELRSQSALELLGQRVIWGLVFLAALLTWRKRWRELGRLLLDWPTVRTLMITAVLVATNWFAYVFAVINNRTLEASLGYYINPLLSVLLGLLILHERLRPLQWVAVAIAGAGVVELTLANGVPPWISLTIAFSFGFYGLLRKQVRNADAMLGLTVEMLVLSPIAALLIIGPVTAGTSAYHADSTFITGLVMFTGVTTVLPLLWFTNAARRLRLSTVGFMQYMAPTGQFLIAILLFGETFDRAKVIAFVAIWSALAIYVFDSWRSMRESAWGRSGRRRV